MPETPVDQRTFMNHVTANGTRGFNSARTVEERQLGRNTQSMFVRHRSGSLTQLHMHGNAVGRATHTNTAGQTFSLHPDHMSQEQKRDNHAHSFHNTPRNR